MATYKHDKEFCRYFALKLNRNTDPEIIELLESQKNYAGYIKNLLRIEYEKLHPGYFESNHNDTKERTT